MIKAEEERDIAHGVCQGAKHITEEEVSKFDWKERR
jgi:hypothetical protein